MHSFFFLFSMFFFFMGNIIFALPAYAVIEPDVPGEDYTVFRTVNTLSCHPQNPHIKEVPHFIVFDPDSFPSDYQPRNLESKGYCATIHTESHPEYIGIVGGISPRPVIPRRHYIVYEVPNPFYKVANEEACQNGGTLLAGRDKFCGKYLHFEGYIRVSNVAHASSTHEAWHLENYIGAFSTGNAGAKFEITKDTYLYTDAGVTTTMTVARFNNFAGTFQLHKNSNQASIRPNFPDDPSDIEYKNLEALKFIMSYNPSTGPNIANPAFFADIPHDRFGMPTEPFNTSWIKCREEYPPGYFGPNFTPLTTFDPMTASVKAVTPLGCDYEPLSQRGYDVTKMPTCLGPSYSEGVTIPKELDGCVVSLNSTTTVTPTPNPYDISGDNIVNITDYNLLIFRFNQAASVQEGNYNNNQKIDIFDYTSVITHF